METHERQPDWRGLPRQPRPDVAERNMRQAKHGLSGSPTRKTWEAMIRRCTNPDDKDYPNYGGRGVKVCARWLNSFKHFVADMGVKPEGTSLGRVCNDGDYDADNCRWETIIQQNNNRRSSKLITYRGRTQTVAQWAREIGICQKTLGYRLRSGWHLDDAMSAEVDRTKRRVA